MRQSNIQTVYTIATNDAIADSGATQIFVMEGTPVLNKQKTTCPLKVAFADGCRVMSMHISDIVLPSLPTTLVGHIVPELSIASLFGILVLTEVGCTVKFDNKKCVVKYNKITIVVGLKDPTTDLWTLPIVGPAGKTTHVKHEGKQDPFVTLYEEHLEPTNESSLSNITMLTIPVCASAHACGSGGKASASLKNTSVESSELLHPHCTH